MDENKEEYEIELDNSDDTHTINVNINVSDPVVDKEIQAWHDAAKTSLYIFFGIPIVGFLILALLIIL